MPWNREKDLQLVKLMFEHLTQEGIAKRMDESRVSVNARIFLLRLSMKGARDHERAALTPEQYLDTSPLYAKPVDQPEQVDLPLDNLGILTMQAESLNRLAKELMVSVYLLRKAAIERAA